MERALNVFRKDLQDLIDRSTALVIKADIPFYRGFPPQHLRAAIERVFRASLDDIEKNKVETCPGLLAQLGAQRVQHGARMADMLSGMSLGFDIVSEHFQEIFASDPEARLWWEHWRGILSYAAATSLADAYIQAREGFIREQNAEIQKLSAPVLPLYEGVILLPLVGTLTDQRAEQVMQSLLEGIVRHRARSILLDVTGVPSLDRTAAASLTRATRAARLMGAEVVLVGVNPRIARTVLDIGVDLQFTTVLGDLQSGLEHALRLQGRAITSL